MSRFIVTDSGSVEREVSRFVVIDSGGTAREISRGFVIDSGGVARLFFAGSVVSLSNDTYTAEATTPANATIVFTLANSGDIERQRNGGAVADVGDWILPHVGMSDYEVRATVVSGSLTTGTTGSWLNLGTDRSWSKTRSSDIVGSDSVVLTVEIRRVLDSVVVATATITLTATVAA